MLNYDDILMDAINKYEAGELTYIGAGGSRSVYAVDENLVLKITDVDSLCNDNEWETWNEVKDTEYRKILTEIFAHAEDIDGKYLLAERVTPLHKIADDDYLKMMKAFEDEVAYSNVFDLIVPLDFEMTINDMADEFLLDAYEMTIPFNVGVTRNKTFKVLDFAEFAY